MLIQPVLRPVLQPVLRSIFDPGIGGGGTPVWTPASLFAASEQGVWLDESDLSTMFQDLAGTVPAAVDSPVGKRLDKSGNGNHWTAASSAARPILRLTGGLYSLEWDGVDDSGSTAAPIGLNAPEFMWVVGLKASSLHLNQVLWTVNRYRFGLQSVNTRFTTASVLDYNFAAALTPTASFVVGGVFDSAFSFVPLKNGVKHSAVTGPSDGISLQTVLTIPDPMALYAGRTYGEIIVKAYPSDVVIAQTQDWMNTKTGAY